jgi:ADP-heptose:LPS heptosyltransferase
MPEIKPQKAREMPSKVLIALCTCTGGMGDAVETLPAIRMIREYWPDVYLAVGYLRESQKAILEMSPDISDRIRLWGKGKDPWQVVRGFWLNLKAMRGYDKILFLSKRESIAWPMLLAAKLGGAKVLYKQGYRYRDKRRTWRTDFPQHVFFQIAASNLLLELPLTRLREPTIFLSAANQQAAADFFNNKGLGRRPVVIINTQSGLPDWGIEKYAGVANALVDWGADLIINGGAGRQIEEFQTVAHHLRREVTLLEKPSAGVLAAVIGNCDLYVGAANGPASVAMALGTPTVILVGPGEHGYAGQERIGPVWWPRGPRHRVLAKIDWCQATGKCTCAVRGARRNRRGRALRQVMKDLRIMRPYRKIMKFLGIYRSRAAAKHPPYACLEAITVEEVVQVAKGQLEAGWERPCHCPPDRSQSQEIFRPL